MVNYKSLRYWLSVRDGFLEVPSVAIVNARHFGFRLLGKVCISHK